LAALVYFLQDKLIFHPQDLPAAAAERLRTQNGLEELNLDMADGTRLQGWFVKSGRPKSGVLLCFGGNGDEASRGIPEAAELPGWSWVLINYRGYGLSQGRPGEKALFSDALEIYDRIQSRPDVDADRIVVFGRSLGTGVAVHVAAHRKVRGAILASPYGSLTDIARESFPWLPVGILLRHPFHALGPASRICAPALILVAGADRVIAPRHSYRLAAAWGGEVRRITLEGADHNSLPLEKEYWRNLRAFLADLEGHAADPG
jgi:pimeloyl-ACP methyl ester carboxylesterase